MSMLMFVPTTLKLWRLNASFFTQNGRFRWMVGGSLGWMSWKWLSTATTTKRPVVEGGVVTTTMGRGEKDGVGPAPAIPEHAEAVAPRNDAAAARVKVRQERMPARDIGNPECP